MEFNSAFKGLKCALVEILKKKFEMYLSLSELSEHIMDPSVQFYHLSCNIGSYL
jgi:hypothetical protein